MQSPPYILIKLLYRKIGSPFIHHIYTMYISYVISYPHVFMIERLKRFQIRKSYLNLSVYTLKHVFFTKKKFLIDDINQSNVPYTMYHFLHIAVLGDIAKKIDKIGGLK